MTLKDYINEEEKLLIDEFPEEFLSDCSLDDVSNIVMEVIEKESLKNVI